MNIYFMSKYLDRLELAVSKTGVRSQESGVRIVREWNWLPGGPVSREEKASSCVIGRAGAWDVPRCW
jgi:hypothetical protein